MHVFKACKYISLPAHKSYALKKLYTAMEVFYKIPMENNLLSVWQKMYDISTEYLDTVEDH